MHGSGLYFDVRCNAETFRHSLGGSGGVIIASIYLSAPLIAKFGNVKEQYMIACNGDGLCSCFVLHSLAAGGGRCSLQAVFLRGCRYSRRRLFGDSKQWGCLLFVQLILRHRSLKQTAKDIGLLAAGAGDFNATVICVATLQAEANDICRIHLYSSRSIGIYKFCQNLHRRRHRSRIRRKIRLRINRYRKVFY